MLPKYYLIRLKKKKIRGERVERKVAINFCGCVGCEGQKSDKNANATPQKFD